MLKKNKLSPEEAAQLMLALGDNDDKKYFDAELAHNQADALLCRVLEERGFEEMVQLFREMPKWYA